MIDLFTQDRLLDGRITVLQPAEGYRAAIDPIFLAASVPVQSGDKVLDIGCGAGASSLCLAARLPAAEIVGVDAQENLIQLAQQGAEISGLASQTSFITGDILKLTVVCPPELIPGSFDHVMANPPYLPKNSGDPPPDPVKAAANVEGDAALADWVDFALLMVKDGGTITFVHRYDRRDEVIRNLSGESGKIRVFPLWPKKKKEGAKRVLVQGIKGVVGETEILAGLVLHRDDGSFARRADDVLRRAGHLVMAS